MAFLWPMFYYKFIDFRGFRAFFFKMALTIVFRMIANYFPHLPNKIACDLSTLSERARGKKIAGIN